MNKDNESIQQLFTEACSGNRAGMERLAGIVRQRLYLFVYRTTLNHDMTEDVLQETLLTMVGQIASLRNKRRFWPWVFRIAWSKLQDNLRSSRHQRSVKTSLLRNQLYEAAPGGGSLLEATILDERLRQLSALTGQLSQRHRDILYLRYYEQLPYTEIAAITRTTPQQARAQFHRVREYLKARLT